MTEFYGNAKQRLDESPEFKKILQLNMVKLQAGDVESCEIWQVWCGLSWKEFEKVYDRLDITVDECRESFYNDKITTVIQEFEQKGLISVDSIQAGSTHKNECRDGPFCRIDKFWIWNNIRILRRLIYSSDLFFLYYIEMYLFGLFGIVNQLE